MNILHRKINDKICIVGLLTTLLLIIITTIIIDYDLYKIKHPSGTPQTYIKFITK